MASLAAEGPDPKTFKAWEDAFKYPIPAVRRMEQQLRNDISGNRERLRTLVGSSYRELLGTADSIVQMEVQMRDAERYLSDISWKCNTRLLDKAVENGGEIAKQLGAQGQDQYAHASQMSVLHKCPDVLSSIFKQGESLELAAKILVLSRHLHTKVSSHASTSSFVESIRLRLGRLRQKLLSAIDKRLSGLKSDAKGVIDAMCAFSLATNSSCADVLRHFHHMRLNAISSVVLNGMSHKSQAIHGLEVWIRTMQDTQSLFPRQVTNALSKLKARPLLQDVEVRAIQEFDLDVHELWIGDDIKNFIPYVRHDDLTISSAASQLSQWTPLALESYISRLKQVLDSTDDFKIVLELRYDCLRLWLNSQGRVIGTTKGEVTDLFRIAFQERLSTLLETETTSANGVVSSMSQVLKAWSNEYSEDPVSNLWDEGISNMDTTHDARAKTTSIQAKLHGQSSAVTRILHQYEAWVARANDIGTAINYLSSQKWEVEDVGEDEDDIDELEDMQHRLGKEDTRDLKDRFKNSLNNSMEKIRTGIGIEQQRLEESHNSGPKAAFILRVLREIKQRLPEGMSARDVTFPYISNLHQVVAAPIVQKCTSNYQKAISKASTQINIPVRLLWDGSPELPIVPSAWPFRLLRSIHNEMSVVGLDLWTSKATEELKTLLQTSLVDQLKRGGESNPHGDNVKPTVNGEAQTEAENSPHTNNVSAQDCKIQLLFDIEYLEAALQLSDDEPINAIAAFANDLAQTIELSTDSARRIRTATKDYWKRTSLLFALLA